MLLNRMLLFTIRNLKSDICWFRKMLVHKLKKNRLFLKKAKSTHKHLYMWIGTLKKLLWHLVKLKEKFLLTHHRQAPDTRVYDQSSKEIFLKWQLQLLLKRSNWKKYHTAKKHSSENIHLKRVYQCRRGKNLDMLRAFSWASNQCLHSFMSN